MLTVIIRDEYGVRHAFPATGVASLCALSTVIEEGIRLVADDERRQEMFREASATAGLRLKRAWDHMDGRKIWSPERRRRHSEIKKAWWAKKQAERVALNGHPRE